jgi:TonB family protein
MERHLLIATISSIVFYAIYCFFLRKESFHQFNRFYLLSALVISLLIPFARFSVPAGAKSVSNLSEIITYIQLPEITIYAQTPSIWNISNIVWSIYLLGVLIFALLFLIKLIKIRSLIVQSKKNREEKYVFVEYDENIAPFSFFKYIFINSNAYSQEDNESIVLHEQIHVRQRHSWDLIFMELMGIVFWFNPILLFYKRSLQVIHEYLADHRVLQQGIELGAYLNLLLRQLTLPNGWVVGHHFNYLLTKNRFKMLKKNHYSKWAFTKVIFVLPVITLLLMLNCKSKQDESQTIKYEFNMEGMPEGVYNVNVTEGEDNVKQVDVKKIGEFETVPYGSEVTFIDENGNPNPEYTYYWVENEDEEIHKQVEQMPEFPGGMEALKDFIKKNLHYPAEAVEKNIQGTSVIQFAVMKDGTVDKITVYKSSDKMLDCEAIRVIQMLPKWKPGKIAGKNVNCYYIIPVVFMLQ